MTYDKITHLTDIKLIELLNSCHKIEIPHPLIKSLFCGKGLSEMSQYKGVEINPMDCGGYNKSFSRIYLTYLTQRLFGFQRLPGHEEEVVYSRDDQVKDALASLTESEIQEHLSVIEALYLHTQSELKSVLGTNMVRLYRGFREPMNTMVSLSVRRASELGEDTARVYSNTLDFFAATHGGHSVGSSISLDIPMQNVLLSHYTIDGFSRTDEDIFVINRSPTGFLDIPLECFQTEEVCEVAWQNFTRIANHRYERDHRLIFENMLRNIPPEKPEQYEFRYSPGYFESKLSRVGQMLDEKVPSTHKRYSWHQK